MNEEAFVEPFCLPVNCTLSCKVSSFTRLWARPRAAVSEICMPILHVISVAHEESQGQIAGLSATVPMPAPVNPWLGRYMATPSGHSSHLAMDGFCLVFRIVTESPSRSLYRSISSSSLHCQQTGTYIA